MSQMKFDQDLGGLVFQEEASLMKKPEQSEGMPQPFTPEYAEWLGKNVAFVGDRLYGTALEAAQGMAEGGGFILSAADLSFARHEIRMAADNSGIHIDALNTSTYQIAGCEKSFRSGKVKPDFNRKVLLVMHGVDLVWPGSHVTTHWGVPNDPVFLQEPNSLDPLIRGYVKSERWEHGQGVSRQIIETRQIPMFKGDLDFQPKTRQYGIMMPYEVATVEHAIGLIRKVEGKKISIQDAIGQLDYERALAGGTRRVYYGMMALYTAKYNDLCPATKWEKRHPFYHRMRGVWHENNRIRPVTFCFTRNYTSMFDEDATFAVIPGGKADGL